MVNKEEFIVDVMVDICEEFEDFLDERDITIPNENREGGISEARIYADDWDDICSRVLKIARYAFALYDREKRIDNSKNDPWKPICFCNQALGHTGGFEIGKFYEFLDKFGNIELAKIEESVISGYKIRYFDPPAKNIKIEDIFGYRELREDATVIYRETKLTKEDLKDIEDFNIFGSPEYVPMKFMDQEPIKGE